MTDSFFTNLLETGEFRIGDEGHVQIMNEFILMIPSPAVAKLYTLVEEKIGQEEAAELFREVGRYQVQQAAERYVEKYNFDSMSKNKIQDFTSKILKLNGFGDITFSEFDREKEKASVQLTASVFASRYRNLNGESDHPVDHWLAGMLEKHFSVIFGVDVTVEETHCQAKGDEHCVFVATVTD